MNKLLKCQMNLDEHIHISKRLCLQDVSEELNTQCTVGMPPFVENNCVL